MEKMEFEEREDEVWDRYARLYNLIAVCMEKNQENPKQLRILIDLALRLEQPNR